MPYPMEGIADDGYEECVECDGTGVVVEPLSRQLGEECPECKGTGDTNATD